jgi:hypothetical protein
MALARAPHARSARSPVAPTIAAPGIAPIVTAPSVDPQPNGNALLTAL